MSRNLENSKQSFKNFSGAGSEPTSQLEAFRVALKSAPKKFNWVASMAIPVGKWVECSRVFFFNFPCREKYFLRWPTSATAKLTFPRQNLLSHGKTYFSTAKLTFIHGKTYFSTGPEWGIRNKNLNQSHLK